MSVPKLWSFSHAIDNKTCPSQLSVIVEVQCPTHGYDLRVTPVHYATWPKDGIYEFTVRVTKPSKPAGQAIAIERAVSMLAMSKPLQGFRLCFFGDLDICYRCITYDWEKHSVNFFENMSSNASHFNKDPLKASPKLTDEDLHSATPDSIRLFQEEFSKIGIDLSVNDKWDIDNFISSKTCGSLEVAVPEGFVKRQLPVFLKTAQFFITDCEPGATMELHSHNKPLYRYIEAGSIDFIDADGKKTVYGQGDWMYLPANYEYGYTVGPNGARIKYGCKSTDGDT